MKSTLKLVVFQDLKSKVSSKVVHVIGYINLEISSFLNKPQKSYTLGQGCADGGAWGRHAPNIFKFARNLVKIHSWCRTVGHSIFCGLCFLVKIVGQLVKRPSNEKYFGTSLLWGSVLLYSDSVVPFMDLALQPIRRTKSSPTETIEAT